MQSVQNNFILRETYNVLCKWWIQNTCSYISFKQASSQRRIIVFFNNDFKDYMLLTRRFQKGRRIIFSSEEFQKYNRIEFQEGNSLKRYIFLIKKRSSNNTLFNFFHPRSIAFHSPLILAHSIILVHSPLTLISFPVWSSFILLFSVHFPFILRSFSLLILPSFP